MNLIHGDCIEVMPTLEPFDCVFADPPFGIQYSRTKSNLNNYDNIEWLPGYNEVPQDEYEEFSDKWIGALPLKDNGSLWIVSGWTNQRHILNALHKHGYKVLNEVIWQYPFGVHTRNKFVTSHYPIFWCSKGKPKFNRFCRTRDAKESYHDRIDVWQINKQYNRGKKTTPRLPEELVNKCLQYTTIPGDTILDPFAGSGTTLKVGQVLGRKVVGIELSEEYYKATKERLYGVSSNAIEE